MVIKNNTTTIFLTLFISALVTGFATSTPVWQKMNIGIIEPQVNSVLVLPQNTSSVLIGSSKAIYKSSPQGNQFTSVLTLPVSQNGVNYLYIGDGNPRNVYAATDSGLFLSEDEGNHWDRIFYSSSPAEGQCYSVAVLEDTVYLGTERGLLYKKTQDESWQKEKTVLNDKAIHTLAQDKVNIYSATDDELYRIHSADNTIQKIFSLSAQEVERVADLESDPSESSYLPQIRSLSVLVDPAPVIYLATLKGVYASRDQGAAWQKLSSAGLPGKDITSLTVLSERDIWVGTQNGVFKYEGGQWNPAYQGMETNDINYLTHDSHGNVYAATDKGIFFTANEKALSLPGMPGTITDYQSLDKNFEGEPTIGQIQRIAIEYAEVHPNKIKNWRTAAVRRAMLPNLSAGVNRSASELFHWDTGPNPDVLKRGKDFLDWDVSLSWNLGDLIWNNDQTSIDSRSKLMVELREDILDQITRLYFERRRLQIDLLNSKVLEPSLKVDKEMRIAELTALIDGFSGGQFSKLIQVPKSDND